MINIFINQKSPGRINTLTLDVTLREQHTYRNDVTNFPTEEGVNICDHVRPQPPRVTIHGLITNTPLLDLNNLVTSSTELFKSSPVGQLVTHTGTRTEQALTELLKLTGWRYPTRILSDNYVPTLIVPIVIVTGLRVYVDMVLASLVIDRDANTGDSLPFTAEFVHISKVKFSQTLIPDVEASPSVSIRTSLKKNMGKVTKAEQKPRVSVLAGMFNRLSTGN
jgi:hypothetical protein